LGASIKVLGRLVIDVAAIDTNVYSRILAQIGDQIRRSLLWNQTWIPNEGSLKALLVGAGLRVEIVILSETFAVREYKTAEAPEIFEQAVDGPMFRNFGHPAMRDKAKQPLVAKFAEEAGSAGVMMNELKSYIGVAYKSHNEQ
jgi:hypothetical protein